MKNWTAVEKGLTGAAVIRTLGARESTLGPAVRRAIGIEQGVFLLETEPRLLGLGLIHDFLGMMAVVGPVGCAVIIVALGENEDIVASAEWILEDSSGTKVDIGVMTGCLVGGRTIEIPGTKLTNVGYFLADGLKARYLVLG
jgi:hypothetical protein